MGNHRANSRATGDSSAPQYSGGKRKATPAPRRSTRLPSVPVLLGVAALAVSATGVVTVGEDGLLQAGAKRIEQTAPASALSGASGVASVGAAAEREQEVSRDSSRQAQAQAADAEQLRATEQQAQERNAALSELAAQAEQQAKEIEENAWVLPVQGYRITNTFGLARSYYSSGYHTGLDFAVASGTPISAIANGVITSMEYDGSYGYKTVMTLEDGTELWYGHQTGFASGVSVGDEVRGGDIIGYVGSTGNSTGPHVHIEVRPGGGDPVDPFAAFVVHGVTP